MPPHCDTQDGPVIQAALKALETGNVNLILPWVQKECEKELKDAFEKVSNIKSTCLGFDSGMEVVTQWFFETAVRLHRAGEGEPFIGIKPAGLDEGPIVPQAEKALETGNVKELTAFLADATKEEVEKRFEHAISLQKHDKNDIAESRKYINAMLDFILYSHKLYKYIKNPVAHGKQKPEEH